MFLFAKDEASTEEDRYEFVPYNYGPMSTQIYKDLERLESEGFVEAIPVEGQSWARYIATEAGLVQARELLRREPSEAVARRLHAIKQDVSSKTFSALLDDVYERFPEYAAMSIFRRGS
jgi:DNA-binding PadR family transcriptional regulator